MTAPDEQPRSWWRLSDKEKVVLGGGSGAIAITSLVVGVVAVVPPWLSQRTGAIVGAGVLVTGGLLALVAGMRLYECTSGARSRCRCRRWRPRCSRW